MTPATPRIVAALLGPAESEIGCDECFEQLDVSVEAELAGLDAEASTPGMRAHLAGCPACNDEHESLRALVTTEAGSDYV